jgi:hypothetical protein
MFGKYASNYYLDTNNAHYFSAGAFHTSENTYQGSSQYVQYYLRGSGGDAGGQFYLTSEFSVDNSQPSVVSYNSISLPSSLDQLFQCWYYDVTISILARNTSNNATAAGAINIRGAYKCLGSNGIRGTLTQMGSPVVSTFADSALSSMTAELLPFGPRVLGLRCGGVAGYITMCSAVAKINQISLPSF